MPPITARTQTRPIYHRDARGTIRLRVAGWEDNRHGLSGRKGPDDMASALASNPLTGGTLEHENYPIA